VLVLVSPLVPGWMLGCSSVLPLGVLPPRIPPPAPPAPPPPPADPPAPWAYTPPAQAIAIAETSSVFVEVFIVVLH
jgi:hypothetical protein